MSSKKEVPADKVGREFVKAYYNALQTSAKKRLLSFYNMVSSQLP